MNQNYSDKERFLVAVNCVIFGFRKGKLHVLLLRTASSPSPAKGLWTLSGDFLNKEESIDDAARRILKQLTSLDNLYMEQVKLHGEINRNPETRILSQVYYALIDMEYYDFEKVADNGGEWFSVKDLPPMILDNSDMVQEALETLKVRLKKTPVAFNMLPKLFTLSDLQAVYEEIFFESLDKRNFRKKMTSLEFVELTDKMDKINSKRGAHLYKFNKRKYTKLNCPDVKMGSI